MIVSGGWDKVVKVWKLKDLNTHTSLVKHTGPIYTVTVSPDGTLCASGGKDHQAILWDLNSGSHLDTLDAGDVINTLCFSPSHYWLCAGTNTGIKVWDLQTKEVVIDINQNHPSFEKSYESKIGCTSLAWSADGNTLFAGYTDNHIRVWSV